MQFPEFFVDAGVIDCENAAHVVRIETKKKEYNMNSAKSRIRSFAANRKIELNNWGDDGFWLIEGSTIVYITFDIINESTKKEMVSFTSLVVREVRVDSTLMSKLLKLNVKINFGAFGLEDDVVFFKYSLLGNDHIDEAEFFNALSMVALIADEYDNKIIATHGGMNGVDYIREQIAADEGKESYW